MTVGVATSENTMASRTARRESGPRVTSSLSEQANTSRAVETPAAGTSGGGEATPSRRYALITPCRDEAKYARRTLESVANQTVKPALWVIVDDGSKDETPAILAEYAARLPYVRVIRRADRGDRKLGGGVIDAFYAGYDTIDPAQFDYVTKLDLDLDLPPAYFETLMRRMEADPRIGTASGKPFFTDPATGKQVDEVCGDENSVGMVKFYRTACFTQIGGFVRELMWDGIDCHRCRLNGWLAVSWPDPELRFEHLRPMGTSHKNWWTGRVRHGFGQYYMGTTPAYMLASALFRLAKPPVLVGSAAMLWGYGKSLLKRQPRYGDAEFRRFLRKYQWACLLKGKTRATAELNERQRAAWRGAGTPVG
jgi:biofilm PGA synthesis N-glycosyltransferase PgaC